MPFRWTPALALLLLGIGTRAHAIEVCDAPPRFGLSQTAVAIVRTACEEHRQWMRPFIDRQGRLASLRVTEAESGNLADHGLVPWQRVASYWRESGTLSQVAGEPGAASCWASPGNRFTDNDCRAFLIDTPWSAAFVSWVMTRAGVPGFTRSPRHIDYIRAAFLDGASGGPYRFTDPATEKPAPGDLLCFIRNRRQVMGFAGLNAALAARAGVPNESHCDIVVAANVGGDRTLHLIGGNVLNAVTMRQLDLDRSGHVVLPLPRVTGEDGADTSGPGVECTPAQPDQCNFNRQDWAVLLKLQATDPVPATPAPPPALDAQSMPALPPAPQAPGQGPANGAAPAPALPGGAPAPPLKTGE
ncbi:DUF2272 domain-containing protein [Pseudoxanthomonas winnipegensis]|uniref:DUF2272 domain-containing protein n=1 Tax=Pseudoxanthomonas winnipegensis TaxID=2480810 RepID=A0A4Q8LFV5_9GAMM|nr:DUF2272 domain-containing protein [Pseudoxanthomonas winnipegensis]TAA28312.1 DUF2272 domain-containing protein [Pseudoxanthomonas winnipegensis]